MNAVLTSFLLQNRATIVEHWIRWLTDTYPKDTSKFLRSVKNRFDNPVGYTISEEIPHLYDELIGDMDRERIMVSIGNILRIRAVQDFSPSAAVGFILGLKNVVRDSISRLSADDSVWDGVFEFDVRIDTLILMAFEAYTECRARVHEIRTREIKMRSAQTMHRPENGGERVQD